MAGLTLTKRRLGFLALKAKQYARFPSISKMSDDWDTIALVAADAYNALEEAIGRAEAAEGLAEIRLQRGLAALDILRAVLEAGRTTVAIGGLEWKGWGTARVLTPAEALVQRGEGDA